jgi:monovalent cation:proton antiporter-2 (CPA2) family protein
MSVFAEATIFLAAAVIAVPLFRRLGLGSVLGYLTAGIVIGPWGLRLVIEVDNILHFAEFGVVLLLFIIGLELQPARLWVMRKSVFGLGTLQVGVSTLVLMATAYTMSVPLHTALIVALALSLSSTAFALQMLAEKNQLNTRHGRTAFSILLFQDMAVIPMLALIPLIGAGGEASGMSTLWAAAKALLAITAVIVGGHFLLHHVLRVIAATGVPEVFTAIALLIVVGTALIMEAAGLSMGLGAFLAGVLVADSEYRHALEADIEPLKGLMLGLFFIAVGMSVNVGLIGSQYVLVIALVAGLLAAKFTILVALGKLSGLKTRSAFSLASIIPQGGEFAFVIFTVAVGAGLMATELSDLLILVVTLSMVATPLIFALNERVQAAIKPSQTREYEQPSAQENKVIIAGFGRFGQIVARILRAKKIGFTALEVNPEQVDFVKRYGNKIYYGDASRMELLRAARADQAKIFVLAIDDIDASLRTAKIVTQYFPHLKIFARARNRKHAYQFMDLGVTMIWRETLLSSLDMTKSILMGLGLPKSESDHAIETFRVHDEKRLLDHHDTHNDEQKMIYLAQKAAAELEQLFEGDAAEEDSGPIG